MSRLFSALCLAVIFQGCVATGRCLSRPQVDARSIIIISDVDDTVKVTNVPNFLASVRNAVSSTLLFAGMKELYRGLLGETGYLEFVSGSPTVLRKKVAGSLDAAGFPRYELTLRVNPMNKRFKSECLNRMYGGSANPFLLIGDDTEEDPEVYEEFRQGRNVPAVYIHRITGRASAHQEKCMTVFTTAYDIAMHEYRAGRLPLDGAVEVGEAVLTSPDSTFFPAFQKCPDDFAQTARPAPPDFTAVPDPTCPEPSAQALELPERLEGLQRLIEQRIRNLCWVRRSSKALATEGGASRRSAIPPPPTWPAAAGHETCFTGR